MKPGRMKTKKNRKRESSGFTLWAIAALQVEDRLCSLDTGETGHVLQD